MKTIKMNIKRYKEIIMNKDRGYKPLSLQYSYIIIEMSISLKNISFLP